MQNIVKVYITNEIFNQRKNFIFSKSASYNFAEYILSKILIKTCIETRNYLDLRTLNYILSFTKFYKFIILFKVYLSLWCIRNQFQENNFLLNCKLMKVSSF